MADIKIKQKSDTKIKKFDKAKIYTQKLKSNIVNIKEKTDNIKNDEENSINDYGTNQISDKTHKIIRTGTNKFNKYGQKSLNTSKQNIEKASQKIKKKITERNIKKTTKTLKGKTKKVIKNTPKTVKKTFKSTTKLTKKTVKGLKKAYQVTKATAKVAVKTIKLGIKATITAIKGILLATKALIAFLAAGGWVVVVIIIVICLIAMLVGSVYGVFFSSEDTGSTITVNGSQQVVTMQNIISDLNTEYINKITQIQKDNPYDEYDITGSRAEWKDILAVYVAKYSNGNNEVEMMTLDDDKVNTLKTIFWEMNEISYTKEEETHTETIIHITSTEYKTVTYTRLHITINSKSANEMADKYNFNQKQRKQLAELQKEEYASLWSAVIYGSSTGSNDIVEVAKRQIGNVGGQPYWSWYGFSSRVEWCACFVSWCANECGYIEAGIIPKFASCDSEGVAWFKTCGLWKDRNYIPKAGDIIFFDWSDSNDGKADHVGIVEKSENGKVYTIEGNTSGDVCKQNQYDIGSSVILGYGTPQY